MCIYIYYTQVAIEISSRDSYIAMSALQSSTLHRPLHLQQLLSLRVSAPLRFMIARAIYQRGKHMSKHSTAASFPASRSHQVG